MIGGLREAVVGLGERIGSLERRVDRLEERMDRGLTGLIAMVGVLGGLVAAVANR